MELAMTIDEALEFADEWSRGLTLYEDSQGWRVVCMLLAEEVRRQRKVMLDAWEDTDWLLIANEVHDLKTPNAEVQAAACGGRACNDLLGVTGERAMATETEFTDEDMAAVGRALMQAIKAHADPGWSPADCPSEIVGDMRNERDEARIECDRLSSGIAYAALKLDQATGPAMVRQAYEDLKALVTPNAGGQVRR